MRFDKLLSINGIGTRKEIRTSLRRCSYTVNGVRITDPAYPIHPEKDIIHCNGSLLTLNTHCYLMLHKPAGVVTSTNDPLHRTVMDLLPEPFSRMELFPIGRLDIDTEGLLIITNDGTLTHRMTAPKSHCVKTYFVKTVIPFSESMFLSWQKQCKEGLQLKNGYTCLPAHLELSDPMHENTIMLDADSSKKSEYTALFIHIYEGKYHQVKKMFKALNNEVEYLKRIRMGTLTLDPFLPCGACRELTKDEITALTTQK